MRRANTFCHILDAEVQQSIARVCFWVNDAGIYLSDMATLKLSDPCSVFCFVSRLFCYRFDSVEIRTALAWNLTMPSRFSLSLDQERVV